MRQELAAARGQAGTFPGGRWTDRGARLRISLLETELRKHRAQGVRSAMPVRQAAEMELAARGKGELPWVRDRAERGTEAGCPSRRRGRRQPHAATCSEPALLSVWLSALSAAAPKAEGKEESRERKLN